MPGLIDYLPDADALISLNAEDLGMILLELMQKENAIRFAPSGFEMPLWNANSPAYPYHKKMGVSFADRNRFATPRAFDGTKPGFLVRHDSSPRSIVTSVNHMVRAEWHDALFANQFVSLCTQRIHRSLHPCQQQFCRRSTNAGTLKREDLILLPANLQAQPFDLSADELKGHSVLKSPGTSPNFLITLASLKSPVAGSPVRLNATAPTVTFFADNASARITAAFGLKHSMGSPAAMPSSAATNGSVT
jgi:hypothetical protein